jgi:magnesium transporter
VNSDNSALVTLTQARAQAIIDAISAGKAVWALQTLVHLDSADVAAVFNELPAAVRDQLVDMAMRSLDPEFLLDLEDSVREQLLGKITTVTLAKALSHMDTKDALLVMEDMTLEQRKSLLSSLNPEARALIEVGLTYPPDSVGRIANTRPLALPATWLVQDARAMLGSWDNPTAYVILVDRHGKPQSSLHIAQLASSTIRQDSTLEKLRTEEVYTMQYDMDQEDAAFVFRRYKLKLAVIVGKTGKLLGTIDAESILEVEHNEAEEDLMKLTGTTDSDLSTSGFIFARARTRAQWLTATACLAAIATVVSDHFSDVWRVYTELVIIGPMIAALGGAGLTQTIGVTVRALANRQVSMTNLGKIVLRELGVSAMTGCFLGCIVLSRCAILDVKLGLVTPVIAAAALILVMLWGGIVGVAVPFLLHRLGLDPATSAGPVLSVTTDIITHLSLFGLARYLLC